MAAPRIPPIQNLQAFEALARLRSVTQAADELNVTPSAVSHRLRQLETQLGTRLFERADFTLTADGVACLAQVRPALTALAQLPRCGDGGGARLRIAVTPTFSRELLLPRLAGFRRAWPDVELVLQVAIPLLDVTGEPADLEIRFGAEPAAGSGLDYRLLLTDQVTPACSPDFLAEHGPFDDHFESAAECSRVRLIRSPLEPWSTWFAACGLGLPEPREGAQFNDVGLMLDAAAAGFGVTLARLKLGAAWLDSGRLMRLSPRVVNSPHQHWLCWKPGTLKRWECAAFADWLQQSLA
ncbi:LysR family transcriptional regulator [Aquincola sp. S2]|uniref:LysR family transcriptional regulator n=1 Tax=Pseudaquabacterium terrae TaxID=2732868 RepID=A0ABX2ELW9_9BURK|nr:LysR substrate-binding domain-containing protein [Aquabacterium terrae]NRF69620.1 LysR family transcriptional regulator [Aquabacterium terrae]